MNLILIIIIGGLIGWLASKVMGTDPDQGILLNIVVGIVGAFIGGLIFSGGGLLGGEFNLLSLVVALIGAIILLFLVRLVRG